MKLKRIEEFKVWLCYTGIEIKPELYKTLLDYILELRTKIQLAQIVDVNKICSSIHIESAIYRTYRAFMNGKNIARNMSLELLLRLSGKRQIHEALGLLGIKEDTKYIAVICADENKENIELYVNEIISRFALREDEKLLEIYSDMKKEMIKKTYGLRTEDILKETLMKIAYLELYS